MSSLEYELKHCEGSDCNCAAQDYFECVCDADWRSKREITLEWKVEKLEATNKKLLSALESVRIELAALVANPEAVLHKDWPVDNPADSECLQNAYDLIDDAITNAKQVMGDKQ